MDPKFEGRKEGGFWRPDDEGGSSFCTQSRQGKARESNEGEGMEEQRSAFTSISTGVKRPSLATSRSDSLTSWSAKFGIPESYVEPRRKTPHTHTQGSARRESDRK